MSKRLADGRSVDSGISRRDFVRGAAAGAGWLTLARVPRAFAAPATAPFAADPFTLGVASGDPTYFGVTIWTRLAPDPLNGGGMTPTPINVGWEVALDDRFSHIVRRGTVSARPENAHAVRVPVVGLFPDRWYWYRFHANGTTSRVGRTRTFPTPATAVSRLRFAFASCQDYQAGFYTAYDHMSREDLDFVVHLGDYIYESGVRAGAVRPHDGPEVGSLDSYRNRHALYKLDPMLQAAHAAFPFLVVYDDHEVENDYAGDLDQNGSPPATFLARRSNAYQAYAEHMPFSPSVQRNGANLSLYRRFRYGDLLSLALLDTRQHRSPHPCGEGTSVGNCPQRLADSQTMMGDEQEAWLYAGLARSRARWNAIGQQTMMGQINFTAPLPPNEIYNLDQWDGYFAARERLLGALSATNVSNPIVLTGDIHSSWIWDLPATYTDPLSPTIATEFVGTSISSGFPPEFNALAPIAARLNRGFRFFEGAHRGYVRCTLDAARWTSDYRVVSTILQPTATISTLASFFVDTGRPGAQQG